jgi:hypothetical protein
MEPVKTPSEAMFVSAPDWVRRLAEDTAAFEVVSVREGRSGGQEGGWDSVITVSVPPDGRRVDLYVQTRGNLSPRTVLAVSRSRQWVPPNGLMLVCAPYISSRVAELCREQGVGYLDGVGNCRITAPGLLVHVAGRPNRPPPSKAAIDPFARKSSRIVRTLLTQPDKAWQVQQLAKEAGVSLGLTSKVKNALLEEAYLEERGRLLYLRDPARLLQTWAARYRPYVQRLQLFALNRPPETERRITEWCRANGITCALTQLGAAWRYSPMVRYDKSVVYVDKKVVSGGHLNTLLHHLEAKQVDTGANCTLWLTDDPAVFTDAREIDGVKLVSPLQLYLDSRVLTGRGEEAAQEILEKELPRLLPRSQSSQ